VRTTKARTGQSDAEVLAQLGLPPATYYRWEGRAAEGRLADQIILPTHAGLWPTPLEESAICRYAQAHPRTGYKRLAWQMVDDNVAFLGQNQVYAVLERNDLLARRGTLPSEALQRPADAQRPDERWHVDIMYLRVEVRWCYLVDTLRVDAYSRYLVHWTLNLTMLADTITQTVQEALDRTQSLRQTPPEVVHDNGKQFVSREWHQLVAGTAIKDIATRVAHPQSNGRLERLHRSHREEGLADADLSSYYAAQEALTRWDHFYNPEQPHTALRYLCPVDYYRGDPEARLQERRAKLERGKQVREAYWREQQKP
jgi:putative transposase